MRWLFLIAAFGCSVLLALVMLGYFGGERSSATGVVLAQATTPMDTFSTSLHGTRQGKATWYSKENGGFETLTDVPMTDLPCQKCHASTYADGTGVDPATYQPGCADCHATPGDKPKDETCLGCHSRQGLEMQSFSDVHREMGFGCTTCHSSREMHGDGHQYASMLEPGAMDTKCENCHTGLVSNAAHSIHQGKVDCTACHSQSVISCYNCHFESMVQGHVKRFLKPPMADFELLVRDTEGKVHAANMQSLIYGGKTFVAIAPFTAHTITKKARGCSDCHDNAALKEYKETGKITVARWDADQGKLIGPQGVIPVPPDWQEALQFDFLDYTGDPTAAETDPEAWVFLKHGADLMQMLYGEPLTEEQMQKLSQGH